MGCLCKGNSDPEWLKPLTSSEICLFSMKLMKPVVSFKYDSCFCAIGCNSESVKLEMRSVGPLLSETIGLQAGIFLWIFVSV